MTRSSTAGQHRPASAERPAPGRASRHRLVVLGHDTAETVAAAGGLLFDRGGGGWSVEVYLENLSDEAAFAILGVPCDSLSAGLRRMRVWPDALIVSGGLHDRRPDVRALFSAAARRPLTEVAVWGDRWPADAGLGIGRVEHRLSVAAQAFKPHALSAAGLPRRIEHVEPFNSGKRRFTVAAPFTSRA